MTNSERTILVTGATGKQGGAVLRHLDGKGFRLRAMTRKPASEPARALAARGVEVVEGDLDDNASLTRAVKGAWGVFGVQNTWEAGVEKEEEQGKRLARVAREHGVEHFVYTSVGSAHLKTGIPHFENKARIEDTVRGLKFPSHVIIRPVFFMENLPGPWFLQGDKLMTAMKPDTVLQMIAADDIGKFGALAFVQHAEMKGQEIDIAGDAATMPRAAQLLGAAMGKTIEFVPVPIEAIRQNSVDTALMLEWFDKVGYTADIPKLEKTYFPLTKLEAWAQQHVR
jgi:uncharacterized protein YbjT (DUF2867 family)